MKEIIKLHANSYQYLQILTYEDWLTGQYDAQLFYISKKAKIGQLEEDEAIEKLERYYESLSENDRLVISNKSLSIKERAKIVGRTMMVENTTHAIRMEDFNKVLAQKTDYFNLYVKRFLSVLKAKFAQQYFNSRAKETLITQTIQKFETLLNSSIPPNEVELTDKIPKNFLPYLIGASSDSIEQIRQYYQSVYVEGKDYIYESKISANGNISNLQYAKREAIIELYEFLKKFSCLSESEREIYLNLPSLEQASLFDSFNVFPNIDRGVAIDSFIPPDLVEEPAKNGKTGFNLDFSEPQLEALHKALIEKGYLDKNTKPAHFKNAFNGLPLASDFEPLKWKVPTKGAIFIKYYFGSEGNFWSKWKFLFKQANYTKLLSQSIKQNDTFNQVTNEITIIDTSIKNIDRIDSK